MISYDNIMSYDNKLITSFIALLSSTFITLNSVHKKIIYIKISPFLSSHNKKITYNSKILF